MEESLKTKQEWTPEYVARHYDISKITATRIAFAHNAALTAERERREQEQQGRDVYIRRLRDALGLKVGDSLTHKAGEIYQQLLSALAAIEEHNNSYYGGDHPIDVDLSLLHEHDAEVRKPLVDALKELRTWTDAHDHERVIIDDALAKIKQ